MLFKLSLSNIRNSLRDYAIYFFTLIIGVSVFYVFNAIGGQAAMMEVSESRSDIIDLLASMLSGVSVFVAGVLGLLIVYASRFLMKRRNKEFALYMMLGMGKGKISAILLMETIIIGIGSLGAGLIVGVGLSQLMSALVANLFEADMTVYKFSISGEAIVKTILYFAVMYLVVMIFNSAVVTKMKLIDLIQSGKRSEQIKLKNPRLCVLIFLFAAALLGYAYYQAGWTYSRMTAKKMTLCIAMGAFATFLIFWSVSGMLLRIVMSMKNVYRRSLNAFTFRQISSKAGTMVFSMTVICLMLFVTICTLCASFSVRNSMNANLRELCPADFEISYLEYADGKRKTPIYRDIKEMYKECGHDLDSELSDYVHFHCYKDSSLTLGAFLGDKFDTVQKALPFLLYDQPFEIFRISDYNSLMQLYGKETLSIDDNEYILICDFKSAKEIMDGALYKGYEADICGQTLISRYGECQNGFIDITAQHINTGIFIVPDTAIDESYANTDYIIGNYIGGAKEDKAEAEKKMQACSKEVMQYAKQTSMPEREYSLNTRADIAEATVGLGAMATFLGLYIGLVFLIACGAILSLKELSESVDSIARYEMLRKIGAEEGDISKSLFRQTGIFFLLPFILAAVHSVFGMKFALQVLETFGTEKLAESITATSIIILTIYGGYFLIAYFCSKNIIKERK